MYIYKMIIIKAVEMQSLLFFKCYIYIYYLNNICRKIRKVQKSKKEEN